MRFVTLVLSLLILFIQYPLWFGKGGWLHAWDLDRQIFDQEKQNQALRERNNLLTQEVQDLRDGVGASEERARFDLGMIRKEERFVQLVPPTEKIFPK